MAKPKNLLLKSKEEVDEKMHRSRFAQEEFYGMYNGRDRREDKRI